MTRKAYNEMSKLPAGEKRLAFAVDMLEHEVLPYMASRDTEYNV
jgi:hypothetical protein